MNILSQKEQEVVNKMQDEIKKIRNLGNDATQTLLDDDGNDGKD